MSRKSDLGPLPMNWRDVFQSISKLQQVSTTKSQENKKQRDTNLLSLPSGRLIRCGQLCPHHDRETIGNPGMIINLRYSFDVEDSYHPSLLKDEDVKLYHVPAENSLEKYNTSDRDVAKWVASALRRFQVPQEKDRGPFLIHCRSGRDRTGVVVAAALLAIGVEASLVKSEFLLSTGAEERYIDQAIEGLIGPGNRSINECHLGSLPWLRGVDVGILRSVLLPRDIIKEDDDDENILKAIDGELLYLRQQNQAAEKQIKPLLETKKECYLNENTETETALLRRMNDISTRQIFLLSLKRDTLLDADATESLKNISTISKLTKRLAITYARRGWSFKCLQQYKEALSDFEASVREAEATTKRCIDSDDEVVECIEDNLLRKWKMQIKVLLKMIQKHEN